MGFPQILKVAFHSCKSRFNSRQHNSIANVYKTQEFQLLQVTSQFDSQPKHLRSILLYISPKQPAASQRVLRNFYFYKFNRFHSTAFPCSLTHLSLRCLILYIYILYTSVRFIANFCKTKKFRNLSADFKDFKLLNSILIIHLIYFTDAL